ncbi:hypothetical protein JXO59_11625 [candidate division KSB1 bacterium]|nr:hypothetical protein [candidate division KSB1 bacterium]
MKRIALIIVFVWMAGCFAASLDVEQKKELAIKGYMAGIKSDNVGLRNSVLYKIAQLKSQHPETDCSVFVPELKRMIAKDQNRLLQLHAQLTLIYIQDDELRGRVKADRLQDPEYFFARIYSHVGTAVAANR